MSSSIKPSSPGDQVRSPQVATSFTERPPNISPHPADEASTREPNPHIHSSHNLKKQHLTSVSRKLSGISQRKSAHSKQNPPDAMSSLSSHDPNSSDTDSTLGDRSDNKSSRKHHHVRHHPHLPHHSKRAIISQVTEWLHQEKIRQAARKSARKTRRTPGHTDTESPAPLQKVDSSHNKDDTASRRSSSDLSESSAALKKLERILTTSSIDSVKDHLRTKETDTSGATIRQQRSRKSSLLLRRKQSGGLASESDTKDSLHIPSAEVVLDNSKIGLGTERRGSISEGATAIFKREIVRLTHTLGIPGWRRIRIEDGDTIEVSRLSGALTNAVYVVKPPAEVLIPESSGASASSASLTTKRRPRKLLLRIYGPQVEHLIDRDAELHILRRLAEKKIGPTLLGTFTNGRFEQFLEASTLTAQDIRVPQTSIQIAKRMRELHDGIELLKQERNAGAFVWQNWDKYKERCEEVIGWLDDEIMAGHQGTCHSKADQWKKRGLVCGVEWSVFRAAVRKYRDWLFETCGGEAKVKDNLIFAHNDTQYGNLMRMQPSGESPLLLPENSHKQLVVIDFEYANANVPGMEFANHFTEWCYDYHQEDAFALHESRYPSVEEQRRFVRAYVQHVPPLHGRRPELGRNASTAGSISQFMLDSRTPRTSYAEEEAAREDAVEQTVQQLLYETRIWRLANAAQWVAWGIVQAKVPGMDAALESRKNRTPTEPTTTKAVSTTSLKSSVFDNEGKIGLEEAGVGEQAMGKNATQELQGAEREGDDDEEEGDEFDYLAYAQERALLFWGDALQQGIVSRDELPESLLKKVKVVDH